jgi:hypothetical protein
VRLTVLNGSGRPSEATTAAQALEAQGFGVDRIGDSPVLGNERTVVHYPAGSEAAADLVARWLVGGADVQQVDGATGIVLVTGDDWRGLRDEPRAPSASATTTTTTRASTTTTSSTVAAEGSDDGSTSTTLDPATVDC